MVNQKGVVSVLSTKNNTIVTLADESGNVKAWCARHSRNLKCSQPSAMVACRILLLWCRPPSAGTHAVMSVAPRVSFADVLLCVQGIHVLKLGAVSSGHLLVRRDSRARVEQLAMPRRQQQQSWQRVPCHSAFEM